MKFDWESISRRETLKHGLLPVMLGTMTGQALGASSQNDPRATFLDGLNPSNPIEQGNLEDTGPAKQSYPNRAALAKAGDTASSLDSAFLAEPVRSGRFVFSEKDLSEIVAADPRQGICVAPESNPTGAKGAWLRSDSFEKIESRWFGALGDGIADDTAAFRSASAIATLTGAPLSVSAGRFLLTEAIQLATGLTGAGQDRTLFQAENLGTKSGALLTINGTGTYEGFAVDGAVSDDPRSWNSQNYDEFTGWQPVVAASAKNIVLRNILSRNSAQAGIRLDACRGVIMENCIAERCRNQFGDGIYIGRSTRVSVTNCTASDVTRIGFVTEGGAGGTIELSSQISFTNCIAEYAHDHSQQYGGTEFNSGFWSENSSIVTFTGCISRGTGGRGFTFAATSLNRSNGLESAQASFRNCYTEGAKTGFRLSSLDPVQVVSISLDSCAVHQCNIGVDVKRIVATIDQFQFVRSGGGNTTMAIKADDGAHVSINNLYTRWNNQTKYTTSAASDSATISKFSSSNPVYVKVSGARTHDNEPITVKHRVPSPTSTMVLEDSNVSLVIINCKKLQIDNCSVTSLVSGGMIVSDKSHIRNSTLNLNHAVAIRTDKGAAFFIDNCEINRKSGSAYLHFSTAANSLDQSALFVSNSRIVGDIEKGGKMILIGNAGNLSNGKKAIQLLLSGSIFVNTGATTDNVAIQLEGNKSPTNILANDVWKSSTITRLATRVRDGSVVHDMD